MNRVDELTLKLADGTLTAGERLELERLVRESPEAARAHAAMLDLVASMRAGSDAPDVAAKTLDRIHERVSEKIEVGVMHKIRARRQERAPARGSSVKWIVVAAAAVAIIAIAVALILPTSPPEEGEVRVTPTKRKVEAPVPAPGPVFQKVPVKEAPPAPKVETPVPPTPPAPEPPKPVPEKKPETPAPVEEKRPDPAPAPPKPAPPAETIVVVATLEKAENASLWVKGEKKAVKAGQEILEGQGVETEGATTVKFADGTRLELRPKTLLREFTLKNGKTVEFARGLIVAQVAEQPADRPMTFVTPLAEVRVLGTAFRLSVDPEAEGATQLDVTEGKVRVKRLADGKTVDVTRGNAVAIVKGTAPLAAQPHTGLVAQWKLDEVAGAIALDSSGNLLHAKLAGDATWVQGRVGGGMRFGATGYLSLPGFRAPEAFTVTFWVHQAKLTAEQDWFVNFGGNEFMLMREGNMDRRQVRTGFDNPQEFLTVASVIQAGQWTHLAVTYDGAEMRVYSNGSSAGSRKMTKRELRPDATFGRVGTGSEAVMDDIRIYDRAVPASDIARIMAGVHPVPAGRR